MMIQLDAKTCAQYCVRIDEQQALQHLSLLRFKSAAETELNTTLNELFSFQVIFESSVPQLVDVVERFELPKAIRFYSSWTNIRDTLDIYQQLGYGVFVNVNDFVANAAKHDDCTNINALFIDYDNGKQINVPDVFDHSFEIETAKGLHRYWLVDSQNFDAKLFQVVEHELIEYYQADPKCSNINRVLRLAGSYHLKSQSIDQFHQNRITVNSSEIHSVTDMYRTYAEINFAMDAAKYRRRIQRSLDDRFIRDLLGLGPVWFNSKSITELFERKISESIMENRFRDQLSFKYIRSDYFNISAQFIKYCNDHPQLNTTALRLYYLLRCNYERDGSGKIDLRELDAGYKTDKSYYQSNFNIQCRQTFKRYIKIIGKYLGRISKSKSYLYLKSPFAVLIEANYPMSQSFSELIRVPKSCLNSNSQFKQVTFEIYQRKLNGRNIVAEIARIEAGKETKLFSRQSRANKLGISQSQLLKYERLKRTPKILLKRYTQLEPARIKQSDGKYVRNACTFQQLRRRVNQSPEFKAPQRTLIKRDKYFNWIAEEQLGHAYNRLPRYLRISNQYISSISHRWIAKCIDQLFTNVINQFNLVKSAPSIIEATLGVNSGLVMLNYLINLVQTVSVTSVVRQSSRELGYSRFAS